MVVHCGSGLCGLWTFFIEPIKLRRSSQMQQFGMVVAGCCGPVTNGAWPWLLRMTIVRSGLQQGPNEVLVG